jgi:hypothetical protein
VNILASFRHYLDSLVYPAARHDAGKAPSATRLPTSRGAMKARRRAALNAFFQERSSYNRCHNGTDPGLSIVKGLVLLHGGDRKIDSRLGYSTRVTVRLPIDCEGPRPAAQPIHLPTKIAAPVAAPIVDNRVKKSA